jgi:septal ring factor EnvC (AmiA/AmiB activator)
MSTTIRRCALPLLVLLSSMALTGQARAQRQQTVGKLNQQQTNLQQQITALLTELNSVAQQISSLQQQLINANGNQQALNNLSQLLSNMGQTILSWQQQLTTLQQQLNAVNGNTPGQQQTGGTPQQPTTGQCQGKGQGQGQTQANGQNAASQLSSLAKQLDTFQNQNRQRANRLARSLLAVGQQVGTMPSTTQTSVRAQQFSRQTPILRRLRR